MKLLGTLLLSIIATCSLAQDTIFFEDFNTWDYVEIDSIFINYDEDGISDFNGLAQGWFVGNFGNGGADSIESVALSSSWLSGFQPGNRNHLRLPGFQLNDASGVLSWRSAPALGNLYMDGYSVLVSTIDPDFYLAVGPTNCDTLMHFAQNLNDDETQFSTGLHHTNFDTLAPLNISSATQYPGKLVQWQVSLAAYAGQTVYISFLHNSDDDNFIAIDDILLFGAGGPTTLNESAETKARLYPNPVQDLLNIELSNQESFNLIEIYNSMGQLMMVENGNSMYSKQIDVSQLSTGIHLINIYGDQGKTSTQFIKQ
jgi:hypothetical protein